VRSHTADQKIFAIQFSLLQTRYALERLTCSSGVI